MGKYKPNSNGKIYSDFALRLGKIVLQYEEVIVKRNKDFKVEEVEEFESTLYVCALQSLSAQFCELKGERNTVANSELPIWGLEVAQISKFPKDKDLNFKNVLVNIRDALCHPVENENYLFYDSTNIDGKISEYQFVRSKNFRITIAVENIRTLVLELSKYLSADLELETLQKAQIDAVEI